MKKIYFLCLIFLLIGPIATFGQPSQNTAPYHAFDFWLGEWNVYKNGTDTLVGHSQITSIIDSIGIQENYQAKGSKYVGTSINKYNPLRKRWEQYWVDNGGLTLHLKGGRDENKMVLEGESNYPKGKVQERITWHDQKDGTVRQVWEQSRDGGKTWNKAFDGLYRRK